MSCAPEARTAASKASRLSAAVPVGGVENPRGRRRRASFSAPFTCRFPSDLFGLTALGDQDLPFQVPFDIVDGVFMGHISNRSKGCQYVAGKEPGYRVHFWQMS